MFLVGVKSYYVLLLDLFLSMLARKLLMRVTGAASSNRIIGLAVGACGIRILMVCEDFMIPKRAIPIYWLWGRYLALYTYAYEAYLYNQFTPEQGSEEPIPMVLLRMRMTAVDVERNMAILLRA